MADIKASLASAEAKEKAESKKWETARADRAMYREAVAGAKEQEADLRKRRPRPERELAEAAVQTRMAVDGLSEAEADLKRAAEAYAAAKKLVEQLRQECERRMAEERARTRDQQRRQEAANRRAKKARERSRKAQEQADPRGDGGERERKTPPKTPPKSTPPRPRAPKKPAVRQRITTQSVQDWHKAFAAAYEHRAGCRAFPQPPHQPCKNVRCQAGAANRALTACECSIRKMFESYTRTQLKSERNRFHSDRWAVAPEDVRDKVQKAVNEIFVAVSAML